MFGCSNGYYATSGSGAGAVVREDYIASPNQDEFTATLMTLTGYVSVYIEGVLASSSSYTRVGNVVTLDAGVAEFTEVVLIN